jgi:hypothetical protein
LVFAIGHSGLSIGHLFELLASCFIPPTFSSRFPVIPSDNHHDREVFRNMRELAIKAEQLRAVREAQHRFLAMWAVECLIDQRNVVRKLARDIAAATHAPLPDVPFRADVLEE